MPNKTVRNVAVLAAVCACQPALASNACDAVMKRIRSEIADNGIQDFSLATMPAQHSVHGRVVGTCDGGATQIVYSAAAGRRGAATGAEELTAPAQLHAGHLAPLPHDTTLPDAPPAAPVEAQLRQQLSNYRQLQEWKALAQDTAEEAVKTHDADLYRAATAFRDRLLPTSLQFQSSYDAAQKLLRSGFQVKELPPLSETQLHFLAACDGKSTCKTTDVRTALFMSPVQLDGAKRNASDVPRPPAPADAMIQMPDFPGNPAPASNAQAALTPSAQP